MEISRTTRQRLRTQGFEGISDSDLASVEPWLRFTPALCGLIVALGTVLEQPVVFFVLAPLAALGAFFPRHPFDFAYNYGLRHLTRTPPLPPNGAPRRFACGVASIWIVGIGISFALGAEGAGYALGGLMAAVATLVATTHICIPSMIFRAACSRAPVRPA